MTSSSPTGCAIYCCGPVSDATTRAKAEAAAEAEAHAEARPVRAGDRLLGAGVSRVTCPYCGSEDVERVGHQWVCACCAKAWAAFTRADEHLLRLFGIAAN